jgi:hypothetical protein
MRFNQVELLNWERTRLLEKWLSEPHARPKILARIMELEDEMVSLEKINKG